MAVKVPPWRGLYNKLASPWPMEVTDACLSIDAWCRSHVPPVSFRELGPNNGLLRRLAEVVCKKRFAAGELGIAPFKTIALLLHDAYMPGLDVKTALSLAQQVTASGLLQVLPSLLEAHASFLDEGVDECECVATGLALLQLFRAMQQMWPGGVLKSKAAAPAAAPAARQAVALLQYAGKPQQQPAGLRHDTIWGDSLAVTQQLMQQLKQAAGSSDGGTAYKAEPLTLTPLTQELFSSPHFLLLVLLVLEIQMQCLLLQQQQQGTSVASSSSTAGSSSTGSSIASSSSAGSSSASSSAGASSISGGHRAQQQTYYQPYFDQLLQHVGPPQQLWDATCSTFPFNGLADVLATLQLLRRLLWHWNVVASQNEYLEEEDSAVLQPLALLPVQLLQLAEASMGRGQQQLCLAAITTASCATLWHALGCEPAHLQALPLVVQLMQQVLAMHGSTPAAEAAGDQAAGSSSSRQELLGALQAVLSIVGAVVERTSEDWGPSAAPLAAVLEQLLRLVLAAESAATDTAATPEPAESCMCARWRSTLTFLVGDAHSDVDDMAPLASTAALRGREHGQLFGLLVSSLKMAAHSTAWKQDGTLFECIHSSVQHVCSSFCSSLAAGVGGGVLVLDAAAWLALWGRCLIRKAEELQQLLQEQLPVDAAAVKALFQHSLRCAFGHRQLGRYADVLEAVLGCCCLSACLAGAGDVAAVQQQQQQAGSSSSSSSASIISSRWSAVPLVATAAGAASYWSGFMAVYPGGQLQEQLQQLQLAAQQADQVVTAAAALAEGKTWPDVLTRCGWQLSCKRLEYYREMGESCASGSTCDDKAVLEALRTASSPAQRLAVLQQSFLAQIPAQLQAIGQALCVQLPLPHCCNNPRCSNMAGATEFELVGGKQCICGGCSVARYCGKGCQTAHWPQHKVVCRRLGGARTAAGK